MSKLRQIIREEVKKVMREGSTKYTADVREIFDTVLQYYKSNPQIKGSDLILQRFEKDKARILPPPGYGNKTHIDTLANLIARFDKSGEGSSRKGYGYHRILEIIISEGLLDFKTIKQGVLRYVDANRGAFGTISSMYTDAEIVIFSIERANSIDELVWAIGRTKGVWTYDRIFSAICRRYMTR